VSGQLQKNSFQRTKDSVFNQFSLLLIQISLFAAKETLQLLAPLHANGSMPVSPLAQQHLVPQLALEVHGTLRNANLIAQKSINLLSQLIQLLQSTPPFQV